MSSRDNHCYAQPITVPCFIPPLLELLYGIEPLVLNAHESKSTYRFLAAPGSRAWLSFAVFPPGENRNRVNSHLVNSVRLLSFVSFADLDKFVMIDHQLPIQPFPYVLLHAV